MKRILTTLALLGLTFASPLIAQDAMNYQGYLTDSGGDPLPDGEFTLTFSVYDHPTAGSTIWGPFVLGGAGFQGPKANLAGGVFNVVLGPEDSLGRDLFAAFSAPNRYLGITVGTNDEIAPRQQVLSAPRAMHATRADHATTATAVGDAGGSPSIYVVGGNVGIGEPSPDAKLEVVGAENSGTTAAVKVVTDGTDQTMLIDGNEINSNGALILNNQNNTAFGVVIGNELLVRDSDGDAILNVDSAGTSASGPLHANAGSTVTGAENGGTSAALKIVTSGSPQTMLLDGNEIDSSDVLYLNNNSGNAVNMVKQAVSVSALTTDPANRSQRLFFDEDAASDKFGFSLAYAGQADPTIDGAQMKGGTTGISTVPVNQSVSNNNTFGIYRHDDSIDGEATLTINRADGEVTVYDGLTEYISSDQRVKENIEKVEGSLDKLCRLRAVHYDYTGALKNPGERKRTGFIAQELKEVFPEMVYIGPNTIGGEVIEDFHKINTEALEPHLVVGVQELAKENAALKSRLAKMEKQMAAFTQIIARLEEGRPSEPVTPVAQN